MHTTSALSDRAMQTLRAALDEEEQLLACGRADMLGSLTEAPDGSAYTFLGITQDRLLWTSFLRPSNPEHLPFSAIVSWAGGRYLQRWVLLLRHPPSPSSERDGARIESSETIFGFSRADTSAARSLRERLRDFGATEDPPLAFRPGTRADRTAGSQTSIFLWEE